MWFLASVGFDLVRALWLAPFGGGRRLLAAAEKRVGVAAASLRVYSGENDVSTAEGEPVAAAAVSLLLVADGPARRTLLEGIVKRLDAGGTLVLLDHNTPRTALRRGLATAHLAMAGSFLRESAARRLRRPAARELDALGLEVERLRLLAGELFQAILARKRAPEGGKDQRAMARSTIS